MGKVIMSGIVPLLTTPRSVPKASLTPNPYVTYHEGFDTTDPAEISLYAEAVSNLMRVTNDTTAIYFSWGSRHCRVIIGDVDSGQLTISLNGTDYLFDIIGFNHDDLTDANAYGKATKTGKAGLTLQMHDLFATTYVINSTNTNSGGWKSNAMRASTMPLMKGYLPAAWQTAIKPVNKASGLGGGSSSGTEIVSDSCFLLAEIEIFGSTTYSVSGEGTQYAYYKAGNSKVKNKGGFADNWWERSPSSNTSGSFCCVYKTNSAGKGATSNSLGVSFAFCI